MAQAFANRTVIVTGGSSGIGAAVSAAFARAGATVLVNHLDVERDRAGYTNLERLAGEMSGSFCSIPGDITDSGFCNALCERAVTDTGRLDVVVNSAGFTRALPSGEISDELWAAGINVNLTGAFYVARAAVPRMEATGGGRIVFIGSAGALTGGGGSAFYSAAKAGINGLVRSLSKELGPWGITVNAVLPALIDTDLLRGRHSKPEERAALVKRIPVGRLGQPEDVANVALFLASDEAGFVCGQQVIVDGGSTFK